MGNSECSCDPQQGGTCPAGRVCQEGACVMSCTVDADCGASRICVAGGCYMENQVPFAEQVIWSMRNITEPMHTVASYALNKLIVAAALGASIKIGIEYRLFRKWREKLLWSWSDVFPFLELPWVKMQLGLAVDYQDDCDAVVSAVMNHQPDFVTRPLSIANGSTADELVEWCMAEMKSNATNPDFEDDPTEVIGTGLGEVLTFGETLGHDFWAMHQLCIDGVVWYEYIQIMNDDPQFVWDLLECTYQMGSNLVDVDCTSQGDLYASMLAVLGCMDVSGPDALPQSVILYDILGNFGMIPGYTYSYQPTEAGVPLGGPQTVLVHFQMIFK